MRMRRCVCVRQKLPDCNNCIVGFLLFFSIYALVTIVLNVLLLGS